MIHSKSKIDRSGTALAQDSYRSDDDFFELDEVFDDYRKAHLQPLTELTLGLQNWLTDFGASYYIAQRLKRKPQILRKLNRLHVRLTQLQDIGGCRIIVNENKDVSKLRRFIEQKVQLDSDFTIIRKTDYREKGRDTTGYRALHILVNHSGYKLELQIRSNIQHYWAESIERTSVIYGHYLKEEEGAHEVIAYFKHLSDVFYEIESGRNPTPHQKLSIDKLRKSAEKIIVESDTNRIFDSYVNEDIIKKLAEVESRASGFNNWIMVFDWNTGSFITWDRVGRDPDKAVDAYRRYEQQFTSAYGFEVVMIGSSDISTVQKTHSHYFGIANYDYILDHLDETVVGFSRRIDIDTGARQILLALQNHKFWSLKKSCSIATLKNHYCQKVMGFDSSLRTLIKKELVLGGRNGPVWLNQAKTTKINRYL